jgi:hypothetical protein
MPTDWETVTQTLAGLRAHEWECVRLARPSGESGLLEVELVRGGRGSVAWPRLARIVHNVQAQGYIVTALHGNADTPTRQRIQVEVKR